MSGRGTGSGGRRSSSNAASRPSTSRAAEVAGPSTHRFADRRQERMRGAGTAVAMQRDFQFKLPAKKSAPSTSATARAPAASTGTQDTSVSTENSETRRRPGRPSLVTHPRLRLRQEANSRLRHRAGYPHPHPHRVRCVETRVKRWPLTISGCARVLACC
jgi:hypothetical protein